MVQENSSKQLANLKITILSLFAAVILSGCGIRGSLKTPPPIFGGDSKVDQDSVPTGETNREDEDDDFLDLDVEAQDSDSNL